MEGELIIVSVISGLFGMFGIWLLNNNWFKRQDAKYKYQIRRAKLSHKYKTPVKEEKSGMDTFKDILPLISKLDSDQLGALADRFIESEPEEMDALGNILDKLPPGVIDNFLKGLAGGEKKETDKTEFPTQ